MKSPLLSIFRQILNVHRKYGNLELGHLYKDMESFMSDQEIEEARGECIDYDELEIFDLTLKFVEKYRNYDLDDEDCYLEILEIGAEYLSFFKKRGISNFSD